MPVHFLYEKKIQPISYGDYTEGKHQLQCSPHLHRELELVCMLEGDTVAFADSNREEIHSGDIFLTFPNQIHYYESHGVEKYHIFILKPDLMPEFVELFTMGIPETPVVRGALGEERVKNTVDALQFACKQEKSPYSTDLVRGYLLALFSEILPRMPIRKLALGDSDALRAIVSFCTQNFSENLSLSLLEEKLHLNKYYISHLFSRKLGLRFNDYINSLRVSEACRYLLNSDLSITEISNLVGFNTLRTFNRSFIKQIGVSPSEYRKNDTRK